jgi:ABC-type phosphate transport system auxiliary subunit
MVGLTVGSSNASGKTGAPATGVVTAAVATSQTEQATRAVWQEAASLGSSISRAQEETRRVLAPSFAALTRSRAQLQTERAQLATEQKQLSAEAQQLSRRAASLVTESAALQQEARLLRAAQVRTAASTPQRSCLVRRRWK